MEGKLKLLYPSIPDEVVSLVVDAATGYILDYCNVETVPTGLERTLLEMCKQDINRLGSEGFASESAGGAATAINTDYTEAVYKALKKHKHIRTV